VIPVNVDVTVEYLIVTQSHSIFNSNKQYISDSRYQDSKGNPNMTLECECDSGGVIQQKLALSSSNKTLRLQAAQFRAKVLASTDQKYFLKMHHKYFHGYEPASGGWRRRRR
jgi:hypothetical protein